MTDKANGLPSSSTESVRRASLAPRWHTAALIGLMLTVAIVGSVLARGAGSAGGATASATKAASTANGRIVSLYLPMIAVQLGLVIYVCRIGRPGNALASLLGRRWTTLGRALADIALAFCGWLLILAFELGWARLLPSTTPPSVVTLLPQTWIERGAWIVVSLIVGFSEEVVYRGYLQTQLAACTGSANVALVSQAILFGIAHGEQGMSAMTRIAIYGLFFGILARARSSLWPSVACHAWTNVASGLLRF